MSNYAPEPTQTTTLVIATMQGITAEGWITGVTPFIQERYGKVVKFVPGDGRNKVVHSHSPAADYPEVTLHLNAPQSAVFLSAAEAMFNQQLLDPTVAQTITIFTLADDGRAYDSRIGQTAVIRRISTPRGNTNEHALATAEIVLDIIGVTSGRGAIAAARQALDG
jgi:hypothetical protein